MKESATAKSKPVRRRDSPKVTSTDKTARPQQKDTRMISCSFTEASFTLTKAEYDEIRSYMTHYGELSYVIRSLLKKWLLEKRQQVKALPPTDDKES